MNLHVGDIVRFRGKNYTGPLYSSRDDLFIITKIESDKKYYSEVGVFIRAIKCPYCEHYNEIMDDKLFEHSGFDSGWFEKI
jgi:hypothetical protein